jgi:hypothetical protein
VSGNVESSIAQVGLRDLLFYVLPGSVLLVGFAALVGVDPENLEPYAGLAASLVVLLVAYALGQLAYPLAYPIRSAMNSFQSVDKSDEEFRRAYRVAADAAPTFFAIQIFRYRTMARFCSVMVGPTLIASASVAWGSWNLGKPWQWGISAIGVGAIAGLLYRYNRYETKYRTAVMELVNDHTGVAPNLPMHRAAEAAGDGQRRSDGTNTNAASHTQE